MEWYAESLSAVYMSEARGVSNYCVCDEGPPSIVHSVTPEIFLDLVKIGSVSHFEAGPPATVDDFLHISASFLNSPTAN